MAAPLLSRLCIRFAAPLAIAVTAASSFMPAADLFAEPSPDADPGARPRLATADGEWERDNVSPVPERRAFHTAIHEASTHQMVIFGGANEYSINYNDVWSLDLGISAWSELAPAGTPPSPRHFHSAIYDAANDRMIVYGGGSSSPLGDLWELSFSPTLAWTELVQSGDDPGPQSRHIAVYDPPRDRMILYPRSAGTQPVYSLALNGSAVWTSHAVAGGPTLPAGGAYDPLRERMVVLKSNGEVWALELSGAMAWTQLTTMGTAPPTEAFAGIHPVYDVAHDRIVFFNGGEDPDYDNKVYAFALSGTPAWSVLDPTGSGPPGTSFSALIYDPLRDRLVLHGGYWQGGSSADTYGHLYYLTFGELVSAPLPPLTGPEDAIVSVRPNPGRQTQVFELELASPGGVAQFEIFDVSGQRIWTRSLAELSSGRHLIEWDGRREDGRHSPPGVYLSRIMRPNGLATRKVLRVE